tara:strand:+ start:171 stop:851 length:681 start_codon:yes stop_codon:yes gene_type:complete
MNIFFGTPPGVKAGDIFPDRMSLKDQGIHRYTVHGIDGSKEGSSAIVLSGGYEDDLDYGDEILYTGEGGNVDGIQKAHQSFNSPGNKGLLISYQKKLPIRVIRSWKHNSPFSPKSGYKYCGLFEIIEEPKIVTGKSGYKICRYRLKKIDSEYNTDLSVKPGCIVTIKGKNMSNNAVYSIDVEASGIHKINSSSNLGSALMDKKVGEKIDFGQGFEIVDIKEYQSNS